MVEKKGKHTEKLINEDNRMTIFYTLTLYLNNVCVCRSHARILIIITMLRNRNSVTICHISYEQNNKLTACTRLPNAEENLSTNKSTKQICDLDEITAYSNWRLCKVFFTKDMWTHSAFIQQNVASCRVALFGNFFIIIE